MVGGHSLGELSALTAAGSLRFEDGLRLVAKRAMAMQAACEARPGTMAAIIGLEDDVIEKVCAETSEATGKVVVAANYNCPGQLVISGEREAVEESLHATQRSRCEARTCSPRGWCFPLSGDASGQGRTRGCHRSD